MLDEVGKRPGETRCRFFISLVRGRHERRVQQDMNNEISEGERPSVELLAVAEGIFSNAALALGRVVLALDDPKAEPEVGEPHEARAKAALQAVRDFRMAYQIAMDERTRVDKLRRQVAGQAGLGTGSAVDLDAARDEIGRRLARLRGAGSGG